MRDYKDVFTYTNKKEFPDTEAINNSGVGNRDGTEFKKELVNDVWIFNQALLKEAKMQPNSIDDTVDSNQKIEALKTIIKSNEYILPFKINDMSDILNKTADNFEEVLLKDKFTEMYDICKNNSKMILKLDNEKCIVSAYSTYEDNQTQQVKLNISGSFEKFGVDSGYVEGSVLLIIERNVNTQNYTNIYKKSTIEYICTLEEYEAIVNKSVYVKYIIVSNKNTQTVIDTTQNETERNILDVLNVSDVKEAFAKMKKITAKKDRNFGGLRIGDYIEIPDFHTYGTQKFEIAAFNHYLNRGGDNTSGTQGYVTPPSTNLIKNWHITFMSEKVLETKQMHSSNANQYYWNRDLATYLNNDVKNALITAIDQTPLILTLQWDWRILTCAQLQVYIPAVEEILGTGTGWGDGVNGSGSNYGSPTHSSQFRLFQLYPEKIRKKNADGNFLPYWTSSPLRDSTNGFSVVGVDGVSADGNWITFAANASKSWGVALAFNL